MSTRSSRIVASVWLLAALGAVPAGAQQPTSAPAWLRARLDGRLDARARPGVERLIDSAYATGIPAEPLVDKALEGVAKGARGELIVRAVRALATDLATAREVLGSNALASELTAAAGALRAGVDTKALERLRKERPGQPLTVAFGVLTDLIGRGVPVASATKSIFDLTKAGIADEQLVAFRRDVERDVGMGAAPAAATALRAGDLALNFAREGSAGGTGGGPTVRGRTKP